MTSYCPKARRHGIVVQEVLDEVLVYDQDRFQAHCLNQSAGTIWKLCDGQTGPEAIAAQASALLGSDVTVEVVWHALYQLEDFHLLEPEGASLSAAAPVTRRQLMTTLTRIGIALPLVIGVAAPAAAQTGSGFTGPTGPTGPTGATGS